MAGRQADELLLAERLRDRLGERRAAVGWIGPLDRRGQVAVLRRAQERAGVRVG